MVEYEITFDGTKVSSYATEVRHLVRYWQNSARKALQAATQLRLLDDLEGASRLHQEVERRLDIAEFWLEAAEEREVFDGHGT